MDCVSGPQYRVLSRSRDGLRPAFQSKIAELNDEQKYRVFANLARSVGSVPEATYHDYDYRAGANRLVQVWCSNDYRGMGQSELVFDAVQSALRECGASTGGIRNISGK